MIIIFTIIWAIGFYWFTAVNQSMRHHIAYGIVCLLFLIANVTAFVFHDNYHFGMTTQATVKTQQLASLSPQVKLLAYRSLGNGQEKVYVYKTANSDKTRHTKADTNVSTKVTTTTGQPELKITTTKYQYANTLSRLMFGILGTNHETKSVNYHFYVNANWLVLNSNQLQQMTKQ